MQRTLMNRAAELLSGVAISNEIRRRVRSEVALLSRAPKLAVVLVGGKEDSLRYIKHKRLAAEMCGMDFQLIQLPDNVTQTALHRELAAVNSDPLVDGVLLQLPLPPHLRARAALLHIHPAKDVDGLHPLNAGNLFLQDVSPLASALSSSMSTDAVTHPAPATAADLLVSHGNGDFGSVSWRSHERKHFIPCTAMAVRTLLFSYLRRKQNFFAPEGEERRHLHAVIVNKSMVVGVPTAALLLKESNFTVTLCSRSNSLATIRNAMKSADVVVTAYGEANVFDDTYFKEGAIVIDVAINSLSPPQGTAVSRRPKLCGDVEMAAVSKIAAAVTPTPGGVGPLTVAHLMQNVLKAYQLRHHLPKRAERSAGGALLSTDGPSTASEADTEGDSDGELDEDDADNSSYDV